MPTSLVFCIFLSSLITFASSRAVSEKPPAAVASPSLKAGVPGVVKHVTSKASQTSVPAYNDYLLKGPPTTQNPVVLSQQSAIRSEGLARQAFYESLHHTTLPSPRPSRKIQTIPTSPITTGIVGDFTGPALFGNAAAQTDKYKTLTLSGVTGVPGSFSQTKTTDLSGSPTISPLWFDALGSALIVIPLVAGVSGVVPPPPGYVPLQIGPDGQASIEMASVEPQSPHHTPTPTTRTSESSVSRRSSSRSSLTSSSSSATASHVSLWLIFPRDGLAEATRTLDSDLSNNFGANVYTSQNALTGVVFWRVPLTLAQQNHYRQNAAVQGVVSDYELEIGGQDQISSGASIPKARDLHEQGNSSAQFDQNDQNEQEEDASRLLKKRTEFFTLQTDAESDLIDLSTPRNAVPETSYIYDSAGGIGSTIYIIDSGANSNSEDYKSMPGKKDWLYVPTSWDDYARPINNVPSDYDTSGHGTCVLSKAAGAKFGVAKNANIVIVKLPQTLYDGGIGDVSYLLDGLNIAAKDIVQKKLTRVVLNLAWSGRIIGGDPLRSDIFQTMQVILKALNAHGVIIVCAAGNYASNPGRENIDHYPALFADNLPILVVGAVDQNGMRQLSSQGGPLLTVSAPGVRIVCSGGNGLPSYATGTAVATSAVAGLAAYLLSVARFQPQLVGDGKPESLPQNMKKLIQSLAYPRGRGTDPAIFNGVEVADWMNPRNCVMDVALRKRRACAAPPATPPAAPAAPPFPYPTAPLPPSEKTPAWAPSNPSTCISSPGCSLPGTRALFQRALSRIELSRFYTAYTAFSSNFGPLAPAAGALITFRCTGPVGYPKGEVVSGADLWNAAQTVWAKPAGCSACGVHELGVKGCVLELGYCKVGDCNDVNA